MIISDEQVKRAAQYLRSTAPEAGGCEGEVTCDVPAGLVDRIKETVALLPDLRAERVEQARHTLVAPPSADEVAGKLLGRIISDSLR